MYFVDTDDWTVTPDKDRVDRDAPLADCRVDGNMDISLESVSYLNYGDQETTGGIRRG